MEDVKIVLGAETRVEIAGEDVTDRVDFVAMECEPGKTIPVVTLGIKAKVELEGDAKVEFGTTREPADLILSFLRSLDPEEINDLAMEDENLDGPGGVTAAMIRAIEGKIDEWL